MKLYLSICICLLGFFLGRTQTVADSLFAQQQYFEAAVYYERMLFSSEKDDQTEILLKKSLCYKHLGEYDKSYNTLARLRSGLSDSIDKEVIYQKALVSYLNEDYQQADQDLLKWQLKYGESYTEKVIWLKVLVSIGINDLHQAKSVLLKHGYSLGFTTENVEQIFTRKLRLKDPDKAFRLSLFLPGVGQMYAGYFFKGLLSGSVQTAIVLFTAYHLYHGYFFTGGMTGAALFYTFYLGGARYARKLAVRKNEEVKDKLKREFLKRQKK